MSKPYYECWAGTKHYAHRIPDDCPEDAPLQFLCACMGSVWQNPAVIKAQPKTLEDAMLIARLNEPPRNPIVAYRELKDR